MPPGVVASFKEPGYVAAGSGRGKPVHSPSVACHQGTGAGQLTGIPMICQTGSMDEARAAEVMAESAAVLRKAGARFAYLHGSRASGQYRPDSDIDTRAHREFAASVTGRRG
jgi:hypothetical protein